MEENIYERFSLIILALKPFISPLLQKSQNPYYLIKFVFIQNTFPTIGTFEAYILSHIFLLQK